MTTEVTRVQGHGGGAQWKRFVGGGLETTRHSIDWDGAATPPSSLRLGITDGAALGNPANAANAANAEFLVCGRWNLLRFCLAMEAPGYVGAAIPLTLESVSRPVGGIGLAVPINAPPILVQPGVTVVDLSKEAFANQVDVSSGLLGLQVSGLSAISGSQAFTLWTTCLWAVTA